MNYREEEYKKFQNLKKLKDTFLISYDKNAPDGFFKQYARKNNEGKWQIYSIADDKEYISCWFGSLDYFKSYYWNYHSESEVITEKGIELLGDCFRGQDYKGKKLA